MALVLQYATCPRHGLQPHFSDQPNHTLHLLLTLLTGLWLVVWIAVAVVRRPMQCQACVGSLLGAPHQLALPAGASNLPPPRIHQSSELRHIQVTVVADSVAGLYVTVRNGRDETIRLLWDESTCTEPGGRTLGRLIKKRGSVSSPQAPTPIVSNATLVDSCVPESGLPMGASGQGQLYIVFETGLGKETWQASVHFGIAGAPARGDVYR